ncbi:MAG: SAM-dependent methyltransferase [Butyrivibrio sp.]|nr:SAM-dependent methyltransferase [Butyrivibrio sp.]
MDNRLDVLKGRMSERLITVGESMGTLNFDSFSCTADVGCDHGYVSMYLVLAGISKSAIAMDLRKGPLSSAASNVAEFGIADKVQVRLSDGLLGLKAGEADSLVIAGMGGKLMLSILEKRDITALGIEAGVLQPQSDIPEFRGYMRGRGFEIVDEHMVFEDGKYYFPMVVSFTGDGKKYEASLEKLVGELAVSRDDALRLSDEYGLYNILRRDELLKSYLQHGREVGSSIITSLNKDQHPDRFREVATELSDIELLLDFFD